MKLAQIIFNNYLCHGELDDVIETLFKMWLYGLRITTLTQDFQ